MKKCGIYRTKNQNLIVILDYTEAQIIWAHLSNLDIIHESNHNESNMALFSNYNLIGEIYENKLQESQVHSN